MFVRKKENKSGKLSVQVIDKSAGKYRVVHTVGCSDDEDQIRLLIHQAQAYITAKKGQREIDFILGDDALYFQSIYNNIQQVQLLGPELVLGKLFDAVGFDAIPDELFRHLVLLVSQGGYPLDYEIFEGNKFEGHTMLPVIEAFKKKYNMEQLIVVADAGLMSEKNIKQLLANNYSFIIGARIKNETVLVQQQILSFQLDDQQSAEIRKNDTQRVIVSYSAKRAGKDAYNRSRGINRLKKLLESGKLTKKHINNKGYNKYLKLSGELIITIDEEKYKDDSKWDGLKGYLTNTTLSKETVIANYRHLCNIEKTFRISKTDLRIRPIFHYKRRRIEAHICIAFAACKIYKELERQLKNKQSDLSPEKAIDILKTIYGITIKLPQSKEQKLMLLDKTEEQKAILSLFK